MKAILFRAPGIENLMLSDIPDPGPPRSGEIRIRMGATSLNGHDYNVAAGRLPTAVGRVLMTDGAGVIEQIGDGITDFKVGDSVISTFFPDWFSGDAPIASFARTPGDGIDGHGIEAVVRPGSRYTRAPRGWTATEAATLPTAGMTAWRALSVEGRVSRGDHVLLIGTGGVSVLALQFAKKLGAIVTITSSSDEKLARAKELGADFLVNYRTDPEWAVQVLRITGGRGVDLVVETGGPGTLPQSIAAARIGGHIILVGVLSGVSGVVPTAALMGRQLRVTGITVGSRLQQIELTDWLDTTDIRPAIDVAFPIDRVVPAFRRQEANHHFGKICLTL